MAAIVDINIHIIIVEKVISTPLFCIKYITVVKIKAAHPFMFIEVQSGNINLLILGETLRFFSIVLMVIGNVPADDLEKKATCRIDWQVSHNVLGRYA